MIKILPHGSSATIKTSKYRKSSQGQFGGGIKQCQFPLGTAELQVRWEDTRICTEIHTGEGMYIESATLYLKFKSSKPSFETSVWLESHADEFLAGKRGGFSGIGTKKQKRHGAWAMWVSESPKAAGIFFGQIPPAHHPLIFRCWPSRQRLSMTWLINSHISQEQPIILSDVDIRYGTRIQLVENWQKKWVVRNHKKLSSDKRIGWLGGEAITSPRDLRESLSHLGASKIKLDWFAIGPRYAGIIGDWLKPSDKFQDKMNSVSRSIREAHLIPGLQFAPFLVSQYSDIAKEQQNWLIKTEKGVPVTVKSYMNHNGHSYVLDTTNPEVKKHIQTLFTCMRERWGFRVFILDRITDLAILGQRIDKTITPGRLILDAAKLIRDTVGNKVLLVGMNVPLLAAPGIWNIQTYSHGPMPSSSAKYLIDVASAMLQRARWKEAAWINASGPLPLEFFRNLNDIPSSTLRYAVLLSAGSVILTGDSRTLDTITQNRIKDFLNMFEECRTHQLSHGNQSDGGKKQVLVVRNACGRIALFNFSPKKAEICLHRDTLKTDLGINTVLSAETGTVFNSPEIHVALPPWGCRLFKG